MNRRRYLDRIVVRDLCPLHSTLWEAHRCPALALQRLARNLGYTTRRDEGLVKFYTTKKQYARIFIGAERRAMDKFNEVMEADAKRYPRYADRWGIAHYTPEALRIRKAEKGAK